MVGALTVAAVFLARDLWLGEPLHTASVMGVLLLEGVEAARQTSNEPGAAALYNFIHFALWIALGLAAARVMRRAEDDPSQRWMPVAFGIVAVALVFVLDALVPSTPLTTLHLAWGSIVGLLAMGAFLIWRHPGAIGR